MKRAVIVALLVSPSAHAYVDPGTGTLILQMLLAALAGALFYVRQILAWVRRVLGIDKPPQDNEPPDPPPSAEP